MVSVGGIWRVYQQVVVSKAVWFTIDNTRRFRSAIPRVRHCESRHSWSLQGIVLDIAATRRLTLTLTLTLTVSLTISCHSWKWLKIADPSEWRPLGMADRHPLDSLGLRSRWFKRRNAPRSHITELSDSVAASV